MKKHDWASSRHWEVLLRPLWDASPGRPHRPWRFRSDRTTGEEISNIFQEQTYYYDKAGGNLAGRT